MGVCKISGDSIAEAIAAFMIAIMLIDIEIADATSMPYHVYGDADSHADLMSSAKIPPVPPSTAAEPRGFMRMSAMGYCQATWR